MIFSFAILICLWYATEGVNWRLQRTLNSKNRNQVVKYFSCVFMKTLRFWNRLYQEDVILKRFSLRRKRRTKKWNNRLFSLSTNPLTLQSAHISTCPDRYFGFNLFHGVIYARKQNYRTSFENAKAVKPANKGCSAIPAEVILKIWPNVFKFVVYSLFRIPIDPLSYYSLLVFFFNLRENIIMIFLGSHDDSFHVIVQTKCNRRTCKTKTLMEIL